MKKEDNKAFFFYSDENEQGFRAAVAGVIGESGNAKIGVAICSPNDHFNRKVGRGIAKNRALGRKPFTTAVLSGKDMKEEKRNLYEKMVEASKNALADPYSINKK